MKKSVYLFYTLLLFFVLQGCGGGASAPNSDPRSSQSYVFNGIPVDAEYLNSEGQIADPALFCSDMWGLQLEKYPLGLVKTHRTISVTGPLTVTYDTTEEVTSQTSNSYTLLITTTGDLQGSETKIHDRSQFVTDCESIVRSGVPGTSGSIELTFSTNIHSQQRTSIDVGAGTFDTHFVEGESSVTVPLNGQDYTINTHVQTWWGIEGLARGLVVKSINQQTGGLNGGMLQTVELIELSVD